MDDDTGANSFSFITFLLLPSLLNIFSSDNEIDLKSTEKSFITSLLELSPKKKQHTSIWLNYNYSYSKYSWDFKLEVENSFINYFDKETEIYKGMKKLMINLVEQRL